MFKSTRKNNSFYFNAFIEADKSEDKPAEMKMICYWGEPTHSVVKVGYQDLKKNVNRNTHTKC